MIEGKLLDYDVEGFIISKGDDVRIIFFKDLNSFFCCSSGEGGSPIPSSNEGGVNE